MFSRYQRDKCKIKITDVSNPNISAISPSFTLRGYYLVHYENGVLDSFKVSENGWQFGNSDTLSSGDPIMWPMDWWIQFNYYSPTYPWIWTVRQS